ncbi:MAG: PAS domain S-box protein [Syntrophales bacterium]|nr:PAS domain S-box protein [Syntrophales bacterium]
MTQNPTYEELEQRIMELEKEVAEHKKTEDVLRDSEIKWHSLVKNSPDFIIIVDSKGTIQFINRVLPGFVMEEMIGRAFYDFQSPDSHKRHKKLLKQVFQTGKMETLEITGNGSDDGVAWYETRIIPIKKEKQVVYAILIAKDITARKQAEETLQASESRYRSVFENTGTATVIIEEDMTICMANAGYEKLSGYSKEEIEDKMKWTEFVIEGDLEKMKEYHRLRRLDPNAVPKNYESMFIDKCGQVKDIFLTIASISGSKKSVASLLDITEDKRVDKALQESEEKYRLLADNVSDIIWTTDMNLRYTYVSPSVTHLRGYSVEEIMGQTVEMILTPASLGIANKILAEELAIESKAQKDLSRSRMLALEHTCKNGSTVWTEVKMTFLRDPEDRPVGILGVTRDISERKHLEDALRESERRLTDIINFLPDATFAVNHKGKVIAWNRAIEEMTGVKAEDMLDKGDYEYALPFYGVRRPMLIDLILFPDETTEKKYFFAHKEKDVLIAEGAVPSIKGQKKYLWGKASPIYDHSGNVVGAIESVRDVTERKKAEYALRESEEQLRFLSSQLLTAQEDERKRIAQDLHDSIGQILTTVKFGLESAVNLMSQDTTLHDVKALEPLIPITQNGIEEVRRICTDLWPSILDDLGILAAISSFCREFQKICSDIHIEKEIDIQEHDVPDDLKIVIYRILQESVNNIAKHSNADRVRCSLRKTEGIIELTIEDNGKGFNMKDILYENGSRRGLGLASMKERTGLSGGSFDIESSRQVGTTVRASWRVEE